MTPRARSLIAAPTAALLWSMALGACNGPPSAAAPAGAPKLSAPSPPPTSAAPSARDSAIVEHGGAGCPAPALPPLEQLPPQPALPDPFLSSGGRRITTRTEWRCRRAEIAAQVQEYQLGPKPPRPSLVSGEFERDQLTITAGEPSRTVRFSVPIARPAGAGRGPLPALIVVGRSALSPVFESRGVAIITFDNGAMGAQENEQKGATYTDTRGRGTFYDLYGSDHPASSMMAWAWGVSRIIDALAATPEAGIDVRRIAVSGCSRNGKGALVVGAFDERIALTIPQESGAGGSASWRVSQAQMDQYRATVDANPAGGRGVQTLAHAAGEQPWFRASFARFGETTEHVQRLPFDQHMVLGLVAPRALFVLDNTDMMWLGDESSFTSAVAAAEIWSALGARGAMGASQVGGHPHCSGLPQAQLDELGAFIDAFLLGRSALQAPVLRSDRIVPDRRRWIPWKTPILR